MNLASPRIIKDLLEKHALRPLKRFGQNFLVDEEALNRVVAAAELTPQDTVLEIGPGIGVLTQELAKTAKKVIAVEKDRNMVKILQETVGDFENVEIICDDIRRSDLPLNFGGGPTSQKYKVVGNLPFYLTAPVIRKFLEMSEVGPQSMTLVVQKEVAQRICAKPPKMSILANSVQFYADPEMISVISKKSFWPKPEVNAAIIKITPKPKLSGLFPVSLFFKIVKAGFTQPRKQLANNLSRLRQGFGGQAKYDKKKVENWLLENGIQPTQRAETLSIEDWLKLTESFCFDKIHERWQNY